MRLNRRATTWERPTWKFATGKPGEEMFDDSFSLFEFENREDDQQRRKLTPEERRVADHADESCNGSGTAEKAVQAAREGKSPRQKWG